MKLVRHGEKGAERPGLVDAGGTLRDLSGHLPEIDGAALAPDRLAALSAIDPATLPALPEDTRLGVPVAGIGKILAIGLNYADHAAESGMVVPKEPIVFAKATSALAGPTDPLVYPKTASKLDWEVELAVIIGTRARNVTAAEALAHVAGYALFNDISERAWQIERGGQWTKGKSHDGFAPLGPWLVTPDEIADPQEVSLTLTVNGQTMQDGSTRTMVFGVAHLIAAMSEFMTLEPGDVIATGTPPGVGMGMAPQRWLTPGDEMVLTGQGLGQQRTRVVAG